MSARAFIFFCVRGLFVADNWHTIQIRDAFPNLYCVRCVHFLYSQPKRQQLAILNIFIKKSTGCNKNNKPEYLNRYPTAIDLWWWQNGKQKKAWKKNHTCMVYIMPSVVCSWPSVLSLWLFKSWFDAVLMLLLRLCVVFVVFFWSDNFHSIVNCRCYTKSIIGNRG